jgi:hypothetical protein
MSLQAAAQHLSSRGRGPDNTLVHMSRNEVKSLNDLAMAHGGQLTINPQTGLPEAGFLSSILPMVAGAALAATGVGIPMAAMLVGGGTTLMTGSLKKGLMAGLGAYGGAGLGSSLMNAGAAGALPAAAAETAGAVVNPLAGLDVSGATTAGISPTAAAAAPVVGPSPLISNALPANAPFNPAQVTSMPGTNFAPSVNPTIRGPAGFPGTATAQPELATITNMEGHMYGGKPYIPFEEGFQGTAPKPTFSENMANMKRGFTGENLMNYAKENPYSAASMVASALTPDEKARAPYKGDSDRGKMANEGWEFDPGWTTPMPEPSPTGVEQRYGNPRYYRPGYASGGPVEAMSNANAIGANTGYPMADISKGAYATPYQQPISRNVIGGVSDTGVNPMTGEMSFANGGVATATPMPNTYAQNPLERMLNKVESMPSDNQPKPPPVRTGGQSPVMSDAAFAKQQSEGQKNLQAMQDGTMMTRIGDSLSEGLTFMAQNSPTMALINALTSGIAGGAGQGMATPGLGGFVGGTANQGFAPGTMGPSHAPGPSGGGGGVGVSTGSGSGGGATAMGAAGMSGTASGAAGAARGGLMAAYAKGGSHLGDYSDGGRLLRGPGDGVSDSIPAMIGKKQPARLADGEFVVPARIVSELGNGSTEAGARKLYAMMDRVQAARKKSIGKGKVAKNSRADKLLPA